MTTEFEIERADDLFVSNDVLCLRREELRTPLDLAGAVWLARDERPSNAHRAALDQVARLVIERLTGYVLWLLACSSSWQPDSRIVRHRKLWSALTAQGLTLPFGRKLPEHIVEGSDGVRCFSALHLGLGAYDAAAAVLAAEPASHVVALSERKESTIELLIRSGWDRAPFGPSAAIVSAVCEEDGIVFWPVGAFDDREAGVAAVAKKEIIGELLR